jgi:hypothetical protein
MAALVEPSLSDQQTARPRVGDADLTGLSIAEVTKRALIGAAGPAGRFSSLPMLESPTMPRLTTP